MHIRIYYPVERHSPVTERREVWNDEYEASCAEKEDVELPWTTTPHDEACSLTVSMDLAVKRQAEYKIHKSAELSNRVLVDVSSAIDIRFKIDQHPQNDN